MPFEVWVLFWVGCYFGFWFWFEWWVGLVWVFELVVGCGVCDFRVCFGALDICVLMLWFAFGGCVIVGFDMVF